MYVGRQVVPDRIQRADGNEQEGGTLEQVRMALQDEVEGPRADRNRHIDGGIGIFFAKK